MSLQQDDQDVETKERLPCPNCGREISSSADLIENSRSDSNSVKFKCVQCISFSKVRCWTVEPARDPSICYTIYDKDFDEPEVNLEVDPAAFDPLAPETDPLTATEVEPDLETDIASENSAADDPMEFLDITPVPKCTWINIVPDPQAGAIQKITSYPKARSRPSILSKPVSAHVPKISVIPAAKMSAPRKRSTQPSPTQIQPEAADKSQRKILVKPSLGPVQGYSPRIVRFKCTQCMTFFDSQPEFQKHLNTYTLDANNEVRLHCLVRKESAGIIRSKSTTPSHIILDSMDQAVATYRSKWVNSSS